MLRNFTLIAAVACAGCATKPTTPAGQIPAARPAAVLMETDLAFAQYARKHGVAEAFRVYAAPDATSLPMGEAPLLGRDAIVKSMANFPPGDLIWFPMSGDLSRSDDLGYTWGRFEFRTHDNDNKPVTSHGKYVTIWKKQSDGSWKYVMDIGNSNPQPK